MLSRFYFRLGALAVSCWLLAPSNGTALVNAAEHEAIRPFLEANTALVSWLDLRKTTVDDLLALVHQLNGQSPSPDEVEKLRAVYAALKQLGVSRIYVIGDIASLLRGEPLLVAPCDKPAAVEAVFASLSGPNPLTARSVQQAVLLGASSLVARAETRPSQGSPTLLQLLDGSTAAHGLAFVPPAGFGDALAAMLPALSAEPNAVNSTWLPLLAGLKSIQFGAELPLNHLSLSIEFASEAQAAQASAAAGSWLDRSFREQAQGLSPAARGPRLELRVDDAEQARKVLRLLREIAESNDNRSPQRVANSMKQIGLALHNYHEAYGHLPPQTLVDRDGQPLLSWRVLVLPFLDQQALYDQFHLDEPWDSSHNRPLLEKIPKLYRAGLPAAAPPGMTALLAPLTENSVFGRPGKPMRFVDIHDGLSNTVWLTLVTPEQAAPWSKPQDWTVDLDNVLKAFGGPTAKPAVGFADGSVRILPSGLSTETWRILLDVNDGKPLVLE